MAQPMQQQRAFVHDLKEVCAKSSAPCRRDMTVVHIATSVFGELTVSRCCGMDDHCGQLFVHQIMTGHEMPLHVLDRENREFADFCYKGYREALRHEGREGAAIAMGGNTPEKKVFTIDL